MRKNSIPQNPLDSSGSFPSPPRRRTCRIPVACIIAGLAILYLGERSVAAMFQLHPSDTENASYLEKIASTALDTSWKSAVAMVEYVRAPKAAALRRKNTASIPPLQMNRSSTSANRKSEKTASKSLAASIKSNSPGDRSTISAEVVTVRGGGAPLPPPPSQPFSSSAPVLDGEVVPTKYWDPTGGPAGNGVGGSGTWSFQTDNLWSTTATGDAGLTSATTTDAGIFQGTAGTITLSGTPFTLASWTFNTTNYNLTTNNATIRELVGPFTIAANVNLNIGLAATTTDKTIQIDGSISGSSGSTLTIQGNQTSGNAMRLLLGSPSLPTSTNNTISVPIIINQTNANPGIAGVVSNSTGNAITGTITNNSNGATMLGAQSGADLTVSGKITGSASVRFQGIAGTASSGAGTVTLSGTSGQNDYTGASVINIASTGVVRLGVDNALSTASALQFGAASTSGNVGRLDMNGKNQTVTSLASVTTGTHAISNASGTLSTLTINGNATTSYTGTIGATSANNVALTLNASNTGTLTLTGSNTYTGATLISGGTLNAGGAGALGTGTTGTASITVNTGGTLLLSNTGVTDRARNNAPVTLGAGNGTAGTGGKLSAGQISDNVSTSETLGALTLNNNSTIDFASTSTTTGFNLTFSGTSTLGATAANYVQILNWNGAIGATGNANRDRLLFSSGVTGFSNGSTTNQILFDIGGTLYNTEFLTAGSGLEAVPFTPVPEPSTWAAGILAFGAVAWTQRRRFARKLSAA